jgi:N-succinyldiaminopimelate aminotransferase
MNQHIAALNAYPFDRLRSLFARVEANPELPPLALHIGEPRHPPPAIVLESLQQNMAAGLGSYPLSRGLDTLREAAADWLEVRFGLPKSSVNPSTMVVPVAGTREALFSFCQAVVSHGPLHPLVAMPNPGYQIYEGAAILAGAEAHYINTTEATGFLPDLASVDAATWTRCQLLYLCSPGNPTGQVLDIDAWQLALELADQYDFIVASDECYSEIYEPTQSPPLGLLQACQQLGRTDFKRCVVFHSLSKRSSVPGLRSGFVAGDADVLGDYLLYRSYHGCAVNNAIQLASAAAWRDEAHVEANRSVYAQKFAAVTPILGPQLDIYQPQGGFYFWAGVDGNEQTFAQNLFAAQNVSVLPGSFMSRTTAGGDPGQGRIRISLVAELDACIEAAQRIAAFTQHEWSRET